jgi:hypothetical protein
MATDIVQSLFGVTPQAYQQAQQDRADAQAMQYARLSPFEQANFAIGRGATGLATALGGALGGQDPQLQMISARQAISKQINYNDPTSIQQGVRMLTEAGDTQGAMMLADVGRKAASEIAQTGQRQAAGVASLAQASRERTQASPKEVQLAREVASLTGFEEGTPQYNTAYAESLREQMAPKEPKGPGFGTDREAVAAEVYGKVFGDLTQAEKAAVNKRVEEEQGRKAEKGAPKFSMPGTKALADIPAFRASVQRTIEPQIKTLTATDQALQAINDSLATDNFASFRAAQVQFARAIAGAGDLSQKELKAAGADPSLLGGTADYLSSLATSTPTADTQKKIRSTLQAIRTVAARQANREVDQQRKIALRSPGYDADAVNEALMFTELLAPAPAPGARALPAVDQALLDKYAPKAK